MVLVHIVWATRERQPLLPIELDPWLQQTLDVLGRELRCPVLAVGNAADHVHVLTRLVPTVCLGDLVQRWKGTTSYQAKRIRAVPLRWQDGSSAHSVSPAHAATLIEYIEHQREHHERGDVRERWEQSEPA